MKHLTRCLALLVFLSSCAAEDDTPAPDPAEGAAAPHVVTLSISGHTLEVPDTIDAGWTTFRFANNGDDIHYAHMVQLDTGRAVPELLEAYATAIRESAPRPSWLTRFGGPGGTSPGSTSSVTQHLEPGSYVWICPIEDSAGIPHFSIGEYATFVVRAANADAPAQSPPVATRTIRLAEFTFAFDVPPSAGRHTIRVHNAGAEPHDINFLKLAPGTSIEDLMSMLNPERARREEEGDAAASPVENLITAVGGVAAIAPGMEAFFEANLTPGDYALVCMVTSPDGRSHIEHGMIQQITVQ